MRGIEALVVGTMLAGALMFPSPAFPQDQEQAKTREATSGTAITAGYGYEYAGLGVAIEWYGTPGLALLVGAGYFPPITIGGLVTDPGYGFDVGLRGVVVGTNHRLIADVEYGFAGEAVAVVSGSRTSTAFNGITVAGGYEYLGKGGFIIHATLGETWLVGAPSWVVTLMGSPITTLNVGIGYKTS